MTHEQFKLDDGSLVGTGLLVATEQERGLMADMTTYPEKMMLEDKDIERALVINGEQRYKADRKRRQKRMRNQQSLGKCNASSNVAAVENLRGDQGFPSCPLSDCYVYSLVNGGTDSGSGLITTLTFMQEKGVSPMRLQVGGVTKTLANDWYNRRQVDAATLAQADIEAKRFLGFEYFKAPIDSFDNYLRACASAIARKQQIVFAWHVGSGSTRLNNGMVVVGHGAGNHSNLMHSAKWVGGKTLVLFDDQNSWGPTVDAMYGGVSNSGWGEGGFGLFDPHDMYACAHNHCTYICTSVRADANDPAFS